MAQVKNPLFSIAASGSVGKLTYSKKPGSDTGIHNARKKPAAGREPRTGPQRAMNNKFAAADAAYKNLSDEDRDWWNSHGENANTIGRSYFIKEYIIQRIIAPALPQQPVARYTVTL